VTWNLVVFGLTFMLFGFIGAHSVWRFFIRQQKPSAVHAVVSFLCIFYVGKDFSNNMMQFEPTVAAGVSLAIAFGGFALIVKHESNQEHPWN
jgi:hypothetical protein